jgi:hypothetical protein
MQKGAISVAKNEKSVDRRLERFVHKIPFADIDFPAFISESEKEKLRSLSDTLLHHQFDLLGSGPVFLGEKIDWHSDYVTGFKWDPLRPYIDTTDMTPMGSDIKRPWELSRCQHFVSLGLTWRLFGTEKYRGEFVSQIEDWIEQNPVGYGVNWACSMEVAIRAVNWLSGFALFLSGLTDAEFAPFRQKLTASLWAHGRFIMSHLEWNGPFSARRANHFLANLTGLFTLGIFFSDTQVGRHWLYFAQKWLEKEMQRQVGNDGVHFERSISYHRLCLEMFIWCDRLGASNGLTFSNTYKDRLKKMRTFSCAYTRLDGMSPLFGDNDDGRLLCSGLGSLNDHRYLFDGQGTDGSLIDAALLKGNEISPLEAESGLLAFKTGGFFVIRRSDVHLVVRAGRLAHMGTHAHCDQLSFELSINKRPVFVDRGTYVYSSDPGKRNLYRGTRAHNVLSVNEAEQNRAQPRDSGRIFGFYDDTISQILNADHLEILVRHTGFKKLMRPGIAHTRTFRLLENKQVLEIYDEVEGLENGDSLEWFFHLAPGLKIELDEKTLWIRKGPLFICKMKFPAELSVHKERFDHSPSYGCMQRADALFFDTKFQENDLPYKARFVVSWGV